MKVITLPYNLIFEGNLILVNAKYPYKENITKQTLMTVSIDDTDVLLNSRVAKRLSSVMNHIGGWENITVVSGWRSIHEQQKIYEQSLRDSGKEFTEKFVAIPGHSEHHTGLAIDIALKQENIDFICPNFTYDGICKKFRQKAVIKGFIERYPQNKEKITGISHEPWHFRYVGMPHSIIMTKYGLSLEEYIDFIKNYPYKEKAYRYGEIYISYLNVGNTKSQTLEFDEATQCQISGNNVDGFIITEWRNI